MLFGSVSYVTKSFAKCSKYLDCNRGGVVDIQNYGSAEAQQECNYRGRAIQIGNENYTDGSYRDHCAVREYFEKRSFNPETRLESQNEISTASNDRYYCRSDRSVHPDCHN